MVQGMICVSLLTCTHKAGFRRLRRKPVLSICGNKYTACYNGDTPETGGEDRPMRRPTPKLQWEGTGLTRHCLSCHARFGKLSAGPPIAAFDLRRLRSGQHRTLVSQSKLNGSGQRRAPVEIMIWEACKWKIERSPLSALTYPRGKAPLLCAGRAAKWC